MLRSKTCPSLTSSIPFSVCLGRNQYLSLETLITNTGTRFKTHFFLSRLLVASVKCFLDSLYFLQGSSHSHRSLVVQSRCVTNLIFLRILQNVQFFCCCCCTKSLQKVKTLICFPIMALLLHSGKGNFECFALFCGFTKSFNQIFIFHCLILALR